MKNTYLMVFSTCADMDSARILAQALVTEGLAACVNRIPGVYSTFPWQGRIEDAAEVLLIIKTSGDRLATLTARIEQLHPYDVPEIIAVEIRGASERYLDWLGQTLPRETPLPAPDTAQEPP